MKAVDTNLLVRVATADDPGQNELALNTIRGGAFVTSGVWIEIEWVLRSSYRMAREAIAEVLSGLLVMDGLETRDRDEVWWAISRYRAGADWADMIHLIDATGLAAFATFDSQLAAQAGPDTPVPVEHLQ
ncbi:MAG TPA: type II toxin-antitoxin system VapC family toxin [Allosphingosinicella sp.]